MGLPEPQDVTGVPVRGQPVLAFGSGELVRLAPQLAQRLDDSPAAGELAELVYLAGPASIGCSSRTRVPGGTCHGPPGV